MGLHRFSVLGATIFLSLAGFCWATGWGTEPGDTEPAPDTSRRATNLTAGPKGGEPGGETNSGRIREGSKLIDQVGEFQKSGDQITFFHKEGNGAFRVLQNLALERVARTLDDNPTRRLWNVSGTITEFRGENYLLLSRAILKAAPRERPALGTLKNETREPKTEE